MPNRSLNTTGAVPIDRPHHHSLPRPFDSLTLRLFDHHLRSLALKRADYRAGKYAIAIKDYDHVLDQFPDNPKIPVSHLHKGQALFEIGKRDAGIAELRALIARFPHATEAAQARSKLNGMGVPVVPKHSAQ